jgi:hypothetical protein
VLDGLTSIDLAGQRRFGSFGRQRIPERLAAQCACLFGFLE